MGATVSRPSARIPLELISNDYELTIRACKRLDVALLALARSNPRAHALPHNPGLHELITAADLPPQVEKNLRYLASVRNGLVHDHNIEALSDRGGFVAAFTRASAALEELQALRGVVGVERTALGDSVCAIV
jgi:hypothetical protein